MRASMFAGRGGKRGLMVAWRLALVAVCFMLLTAPECLAAKKKSQNPKTLPPHSKPYGSSYGEWGAKWWQWAFSMPVSINPLFDETGEDAGQGQSGPVFFLAGVINVSGTAERTITVPAGKALFFPILNVEADNVGVDPPYTIEELFALADGQIDVTTDLHATIDGVPLKNLFSYRGTSPSAFTYVLPEEDNIYQFFGIDVSGTIYPAVSDGFWLMLAPLPVGQHTINFGGTFGDPVNFSLDVTYHITVVPKKK